MEQTVNDRVIVLKKELGLSNSEFCLRAKISTGTLYTIQNGVQMKSKTINGLVETFNVNKDWLLNGKGKMFAEIKKETTATNVDPWKDALVSQIKEENTGLKKEVERLWQLLQHHMGGATPNFHNATDIANMLLFPNQAQQGLGAVA